MRREIVSQYLGYELVVTSDAIIALDRRFKSMASARKHIRDMRRLERQVSIEEVVEREVVIVGWGGRSEPMYRYRDELHLPDHMRGFVR